MNSIGSTTIRMILILIVVAAVVVFVALVVVVGAVDVVAVVVSLLLLLLFWNVVFNFSFLDCKVLFLLPNIRLLFDRNRHVISIWQCQICLIKCSALKRFVVVLFVFFFWDSVWLAKTSWCVHCCSIHQFYWVSDHCRSGFPLCWFFIRKADKLSSQIGSFH